MPNKLNILWKDDLLLELHIENRFSSKIGKTLYFLRYGTSQLSYKITKQSLNSMK